MVRRKTESISIYNRISYSVLVVSASLTWIVLSKRESPPGTVPARFSSAISFRQYFPDPARPVCEVFFFYFFFYYYYDDDR